MHSAPVSNAELLPTLASTVVERILPAIGEVPTERQTLLDELAAEVRARLVAGQPVELTFICTHNSRRSHLGQIWSAVAAAYYGAKRVEVFSGGTEVTALNPRVVRSLVKSGFLVEDPGGANPRYQVTFARSLPPLCCFSKLYDADENPKQDFIAIMTCSSAADACPVVSGAARRLALTYSDPKSSDGTAEEVSIYDARSLQIAREMFFVFARAVSAGSVDGLSLGPG
jgi:protein-tyrosine-phosphatase